METNQDRNNSKYELTERMLVIVNRDWSRTYAASVRRVKEEEGIRYLSARCRLRKSSIISAAANKDMLSSNMDELATIIEDRISEISSHHTLTIAGAEYFLS